MAIEAFRPAAWDMEIWDRVAIGPCLKPLEIETVSECIVSLYTPAAADPTWPMLEE